MEKYDLMQRIMVRAPFLPLQALPIPHMKRSEGGTGAVGNMSSVHGHIVTVKTSRFTTSPNSPSGD